MSSNEVVKSVAKKLKYYFEIKRAEDGFDLSDVHQPQLDHPPLKVRPALQYDGLHDRALKHYFSQPEVRVQLTHLNGPNARGALHGRKELQVRRMLDNYMSHYSFQAECISATPRKSPVSPKRAPIPKCCQLYTSKGCPLKADRVLRRKKKQKNIIGGYPVLRSVPEQHISRGEASRLVNSATKILVASEVLRGRDKSPKIPKKEKPASAPRSFECRIDENAELLDYSEFIKKRSRRPATAKSYYDTQSKKQVSSAKPKAYDDLYVDRQLNRTPAPPRPRSPTPSQSTSTTVSDRPRSAKYSSRTIINAPEPRQQEEVAVVRSTQTAADYEPRKSEKTKPKSVHGLENEVNDGPWCEYQIYVCTGDRIGAGTKAPIKLTMYGEKGRTKEFKLTSSESKRHKIPFQKGREDLFILPARHIGRLTKIQIGHDRPELNFAWFLNKVTIYDMHARRIFQFPCGSWLSGQDGDRRTYRILQVDRERDFIDALDDSMNKDPKIDSNESESSTLKEDGRYKNDKKDNYSTMVKPSDFSDTDSTTDTSSSITSSRQDSPRAKIPVNTHGSVPRPKKKDKYDDYDEKARTGTVITLHSGPNAKKVDEIHMDPRGEDFKAKSGSEYVEGYKAALSANEEERKKQLERGREMERSMLQGKSIQDAVRDGDMERVKELLHHFPEMRDFKDESGWTPIHLAAARGNIEPLRWLVTSDADINAETPTGYNAMHIAAMNGHVNSMMFLQAMGSSIFGVTSEKQTALHLAAKSGHLECVKWLVANRASLVAEDNFGRTAHKLAEDFGHEACSDFLRVCMRELSNPRSTFSQMHGRRLSGSNLPPIEEDTGSASSGSPWKDDIEVKGGKASDSEDENMNKKRTAAQKKELEEKRKVYDQQHQHMEEKGVSFLDSIRQEAND